MRDLAPTIHRQRLVIEGLCPEPIDAPAISAYLTALSDCIGMVTLLAPVTHRSPLYGWVGWIHWETSGAHFYGWDSPGPFFSVDIYACKPFAAAEAVELTRRTFASTTLEYQEF